MYQKHFKDKWKSKTSGDCNDDVVDDDDDDWNDDDGVL